MRRGTTPTFNITVTGCDLSGADSIFVTFKQGKAQVDKTGDDLAVSGNKIAVLLKQEDTLQFDADQKVSMQIRIKTNSGTVIASGIKSLTVDEILKEGVI